MTDSAAKQPELLPCPNPDCRSEDAFIIGHGVPNDEGVRCGACGLVLAPSRTWNRLSLAVQQGDERKQHTNVAIQVCQEAQAVARSALSRVEDWQAKYNKLRELLQELGESGLHCKSIIRTIGLAQTSYDETQEAKRQYDNALESVFAKARELAEEAKEDDN